MNLEKLEKYSSSNIFLEIQYVFNELKLSKELITDFHEKLKNI